MKDKDSFTSAVALGNMLQLADEIAQELTEIDPSLAGLEFDSNQQATYIKAALDAKEVAHVK